MRQVFKVVLPAMIAAVLILLPGAAYAQNGNIAGVARDQSGGVIPGVTVEVASPALIEKVRAATTDESGRYLITRLPVGTYTVTFKLSSFATVVQENVRITTDVTAQANAELRPGTVSEVVTVIAEPPTVDVANVQQRTVFTGEEIRDLPTQRNARDLAVLVPGIAQGANVGVCSGGSGNGGQNGQGDAFCTPILLAFNSHTSSNDNDGLNQGRLKVDGMTVGANGAGTSSYLADVANAQEITFTLSGGLGESENGGATINIVPRTGGNRYAGNFFFSYTQNSWADRNLDTRASPGINTASTIDQDRDISGAFGGPIIKDRLWFYSVARHQIRDTNIAGAYLNVNEGIFGAHFVPKDGLNGRPGTPGAVLTRDDIYKNINLRLTVQATQKNKFNVFWDEQDVCFSPCEGIQTNALSPETVTSLRTWPNRVAQLSWTNPITSRILLDAGFSALMQHVDQTRHPIYPNYVDIPRITETQQGSLSSSGVGMSSGSKFFATMSNIDNYQSRASASYITGSHNVKVGYDGAYLQSISQTGDNNLRLMYNYGQPASTCLSQTLSTFPCGNNTVFRPEDPFNLSRSTVPTSFTISVGDRKTDQRVVWGALYAQEQWTLNRFTLSGALRYEKVTSSYAPTCVGPDLYVPVGYCVNDPNDAQYQAAVAAAPAGRAFTEPGKGVNFNDITPRWGVSWDVFGNGKTAIKYNMGKYFGSAGISGIYVASNPAGRVTNTLQRNWNDDDGDRRVDCDIMNFTAQDNRGAGGDRCAAPQSGPANQFGVSPYAIDLSGSPIGLTTTECGRREPGVRDAVINYCDNYGENLLDGWNKRRYEWQFGLGIQHELLPRFSAEVTYNRRWYGNQQLTDNVGQGCDLYSGTAEGAVDDPDVCMASAFDRTYPGYDFYSVNAPVDSRLPNGGGYSIVGLGNQDLRPGTNGLPQNLAFTTQNAVTFTTRQHQVWRGVDTNFVLRARGGLRISGGTSTGSQYTDNCEIMVNTPNVITRVGGDPGCKIDRPFQTNVRATASYTIPWVDILASTVFQYRPGVEISANMTYNVTQLSWDAQNAARARVDANGTLLPNVANDPNDPYGAACAALFVASGPCLYQNGFNPANQTTVNLLNAGDMYGEGLRLMDLKFAKNFRFANRRLNVGVDVYNLFNSDAITSYNNTYNPTAATGNPWKTPTGIISPRYARLSIQFDF